jgi:xylulokinase
VDAEDWWRAAGDCVPRLLALPGVHRQAVAAIGVTGAMHALVPVDAGGSVVGPTLTWFDQRCRPQAERLRKEWSDAFEAVGGVGVHTSSARLRWLKEALPEVVQQTHRFLLPKDFLRQRLTGRFATDPSDARSTAMVDRTRGSWRLDLVESALEVPPDRLPEILPPTTVAGEVTPAAAEALGVPAGTPVAVGMGDVSSTLLGVNAFQPGRLCVYLGTGAWATRTLPPDTDHEPRTAWAGSTTACGSALNWARRLLHPGEASGAVPDYDAVEASWRRIPAGAEGLLFLPHLMGERGRCGDPDARGAFFGLTLGHGPDHLLRAVLEGALFQIRRENERAEVTPELPLTLSGGPAGSATCRQVVADIMGRHVTVPAFPGATALGAALIAAVAVGHFDSVRAGAAAWVRPGLEAAPREPGVSIYADMFGRFCELESALKPLYGRGGLR